MSHKVGIFAAIALATSTPAFAQYSTGNVSAASCATDYFNTAVAASALFKVPSAEWNKAKLASLGSDNMQKLAEYLQRSTQRTLNNDADKIFRAAEQGAKSGQPVNWKQLHDTTHFIFDALIDKLEKGTKLDGNLRAKTSVDIASYIKATTKDLAAITKKPAECLVLAPKQP